jgi:hypothetical protein
LGKKNTEEQFDTISLHIHCILKIFFFLLLFFCYFVSCAYLPKQSSSLCVLLTKRDIRKMKLKNCIQS